VAKVHGANKMGFCVLKTDRMQVIFQDSDLMKPVKLRKDHVLERKIKVG
jgi:hypothetical protein